MTESRFKFKTSGDDIWFTDIFLKIELWDDDVKSLLNAFNNGVNSKVRAEIIVTVTSED